MAKKKKIEDLKIMDQVKDTSEKIAEQVKGTSEKVAKQFKNTSKKVAKAVRQKVAPRKKKAPWYAYLAALPAVVLVFLLVRKQRQGDRFSPRMIPATGTGSQTSGQTRGPGAPQGTSPTSIQGGMVQEETRSAGYGSTTSHAGSSFDRTIDNPNPVPDPGHVMQTGTVHERSTEKPDDLTMIEGIGPKITKLLANEGIRTFSDLADADPVRLEQILRDNNLHMANPTTWPAQARMVADGDWERFNELRNQLSTGRPKDLSEE